MCQVWSLDPSTDDKSRALIEKMILEEQYPYQIVYSCEEYKPYTDDKVILLAEHWFRKDILFKCWSLKRSKLKCINPLGKIRELFSVESFVHR